MIRSARFGWTVAVGLLAVVSGLLVAGSDAAATSAAVTVGTDSCAAGWTASAGGPMTFVITNTAGVGLELFLENADSGALYLEVQGMGAGATRSQSVTLGNGRYRFECLPVDSDPVTGPVVTVTGAGSVAKATPGLVPVTNNELIPALQAYHAWVTRRLATLQTQVAAIGAAAEGGNRARTRQAWLTALSTFDTLGGAYDAFEDDGNAVLGSATTPHTETTAMYHHGFARLEMLLWRGGSMASVRAEAATQSGLVTTLRKDFTDEPIQARDIGLRVHEILENSLQWDLRGRTDHGSGDTLAVVAAKIAGSREILTLLTPVVRPRYARLPATNGDLDALAGYVSSFRTATGWRPLDELSTAQRERLDALTDQALEDLAPIATFTEPRTVVP